MTDTIAAIATPLGAGGLGVLRLSGPLAVSIADGVFRTKTPLSQPPPRGARLGELHEDGVVLDQALALVFRAPRSYTGEDVVEFSCHGGPAVLRGILDLLLRRGARAAGPGEFTQRAFLNGKMDLSQAEAVAALIGARSAAQGRLALNHLRGGLARETRPWREKLLALLAALEANLDFAEEEVPDLPRQRLRETVAEIGAALAAFLAAARDTRAWREGWRVALAGRPNVGKSSLFNALLKADRAIVTPLPGTTRDTLDEAVVWDGLPVVLTDTAGLRRAENPVERAGLERARRAAETADAVLWVVDAAAEPAAEDRAAFRPPTEGTGILVLNKCDRPVPENAESLWRAFLGAPAIPAVRVSAVTGAGLADLRRAVTDGATGGRDPHESAAALNARQTQLLRDAEAALGRAAADPGPDEAVALDLREALARLNEITGDGAPDEVIHAVFSNFCIGK
ncbi:MAG: tRNA uridine-5-carboxymethylaminomethyl(34) synthesis GTPase MnmE [Elusimicrobia bacterium]|nr:tRNA uridine-5-carboxymethylaminomethyl(34) synthesis GTPase MnmE [Elusimicrobiota bacterium]MBK7207586.1 tRNA uridine-5-carboxymethylaminomethyl(34) synthesis GTPase MnmE [Elusimicrobiota bacterium]MBK7544356.1 tRNA uridine-5-carboxymethylaminomethyl(34) synthesis GTPase MnmE [Elusimicrobiota bacterium]MBK7573878.1 tRNA uridine-5-carboxymethylaminomethyl(34) synthesis GTPase MnmE [Elusimicrobiota bacterium]MBK8126021.1 tRNA uridine-5-carboxymethylaminomethyl(34) synthesis GTPase MnmE [Elusi